MFHGTPVLLHFLSRRQVAPPDEHEGQPESEFLAGGVEEEVTAEDLMMPFAAAGSEQLRKQLQSVANREPMKDL